MSTLIVPIIDPIFLFIKLHRSVNNLISVIVINGFILYMPKDKGNGGRKLSTISQKTIVKDWARIGTCPVEVARGKVQ